MKLFSIILLCTFFVSASVSANSTWHAVKGSYNVTVGWYEATNSHLTTKSFEEQRGVSAALSYDVNDYAAIAAKGILEEKGMQAARLLHNSDCTAIATAAKNFEEQRGVHAALSYDVNDYAAIAARGILEEKGIQAARLLDNSDCVSEKGLKGEYVFYASDWYKKDGFTAATTGKALKAEQDVGIAKIFAAVPIDMSVGAGYGTIKMSGIDASDMGDYLDELGVPQFDLDELIEDLEISIPKPIHLELIEGGKS